MKTTKIFGFGLVAATAALSLFTNIASAQQPPPAAAAPAKVAPKAALTPPPAKVEAPAKAAPKTAAKAAEPSPCKGLVEAACKAKADVCGWIVPTKIDAKTGAADKAYCRKVAGIAKKDPAAAAAKAAPKAVEKAAAPAAPKVIEKAAAPKVAPKAVPPPAAAK